MHLERHPPAQEKPPRHKMLASACCPVSPSIEKKKNLKTKQLPQTVPRLHGAVAPATSRALHCVENAPGPVLEQVRHVADRVAMRNQVPASSSITIVVEP